MYLWKYFPSSFLFWLLCAFLQSSSVNRVLEYLKITQFLSHKNFFVNLLLTHHPNHPSLHHVDHHHTIPLFHPSLSLWVILLIFLSNRCTSSFSPNTHFFPPQTVLPSFLLLSSGLIRRQRYKSITGPSGAAVPLPRPPQLADWWLETLPEWPDCRQKAKLCLESSPGFNQGR